MASMFDDTISINQKEFVTRTDLSLDTKLDLLRSKHRYYSCALRCAIYPWERRVARSNRARIVQITKDTLTQHGASPSRAARHLRPIW